MVSAGRPARRRGAPPRRPPQVPRAPAARGGTPQPSRRARTEDREPLGGPAPPGRRTLALEAAVAGLDRQEEAVARREREARHVEEGVVGHREAVQREHADHGGQPAEQHGELEGDRDEHGPAVHGAAAHVERVADGARVVLHEVAADAAEDAAQQHEERQDRPLDAERLGQLLHREGRVRVDARVAGVARARGRRDQRARAVELGEQAPDRRARHNSSGGPSAARALRCSDAPRPTPARLAPRARRASALALGLQLY